MTAKEKHGWVRQPHMPVTYPKLYLDVARERGVDPQRILDETGIRASVLTDPAGKISPHEFALLVDSVLRHSGNDCLGIEVGLRQPLTTHGSLGFALMCCSTVAQALGLLERFWHLRGRGIEWSWRVQGESLALDFQSELPAPDALLQVMLSSIMTGFYRGLEFLVGRTVSDGEIWLTQPEPEGFDRFRSRLPIVRFDMPVAQIRIPAALRDQPLVMASPDALGMAVAQCERELAMLGEGEPDMPARARKAMRLGKAGYPSPEDLAGALHLSPRTFRRHLQAQGGSYRQLLEHARQRDALALLENPALEVRQVGELLGYADPANFTRAFRQWTGMTPSQFRGMRQAG